MITSETVSAAEPAITPGSILVVDDEAAIRHGLTAVLRRDGHQVSDAARVQEALKLLRNSLF